jgi:hypothetical protein
MKNHGRFWLALLVAVVLPTPIVVLRYAWGSLSIDDGYGWIRTRGFGILALLISGGHVLVLGLPAFLVLKSFKRNPLVVDNRRWIYFGVHSGGDFGVAAQFLVRQFIFQRGSCRENGANNDQWCANCRRVDSVR